MRPLVILISLLSTFHPTTLAQNQQQDRTDPLARFEKDSTTYQKLWREGDYKGSLDHLESAIVKSSDGVPMRWLYDRAELMYMQGRYDDAIHEIEWLHYRRPAPSSALQLARYHQARGNLDDYKHILERTQERYKRFSGDKDDTENTIAIILIRERLGENPRSLFSELLRIEDEDKEDKVAIHLAAGELAFRKFDYDLASKQFQKALEFEADHLDALAGLAECYWKSMDPRLEATMEQVLNINPTHPRILGIKAERLLDGGKPAEALVLIETVLKKNPNDTRFIGLKAAAHFLEDDIGQMAVIQQRALLYNPKASEVFRITGRVASRHYRFKEGLKFQRKALEIRSDDHLARAFMGFDLLRLGRDEEGRTALEASFEVDRFNVQVYNMLELLDTLATYATIKEGPFVIRMPEREKAVWGEEVRALLSTAHDRFSKKYDIQLEHPIHVQIFDNHDDFMVRSVGLPGAIGYLGICFGQLITMDAPSARTKGSMNWRATLWHEFVHVITLQKTKNRMPRWLSEGISVYEEVVEKPAWGQRPNPQYKSIIDEGPLPGLDELETYFTAPGSEMHVIFGYFIAAEFVQFYTDTYGHKALVNALEAIGEGATTTLALVKSSGTDLDTLNQSWRARMKKHFAAYDNLPSSKPSMLSQVTGGAVSGGGMGMTSPFAEALKKAQTALNEENYDEAVRWLEEADALFPGMVGEGSPIALLAQVYERQDNTQEKQKAWERIFERDGSDWQSCHKLAEIYAENALWSRLEEVSQRGLSIDPFDVTMLRGLTKAQVQTQKQKAALHSLGTLSLLDPDRRTDYALERIDLQIQRNALKEARRETLELLERVPFSWEAQRRLLKLKGADVSP